MTKHDFRFKPEDHERMKATLDSLSDNPTEEEAEAVLQACGTSGKEVVNEFIERLLKENLELKQELARRAAVTAPRGDVATTARNRDVAQRVVMSTEGVLGERFDIAARHELADRITAALDTATSSPTPAESESPSPDAAIELLEKWLQDSEVEHDEGLERLLRAINQNSLSDHAPAERTRVEGEQGTWYCLDCDSQQPIEGAWMCSDGNVRCAVHRQQFSGEQRAAALKGDR